MGDNSKAIAFNQKITNLAVILMLILVTPLLIYVNFFSQKEVVFHSITVISNHILLGIFLAIIPLFKITPYAVKRSLLFVIMYYFGIKSIFLSNTEFAYSVFILLTSYTLLTSSARISFFVVGSAVASYVLVPILTYFKIIHFYFDPIIYHSNVQMIAIRAFESIMGIIFMAGLIYFVFKNNKNNIALLEKRVTETNFLNATLLREVSQRKKAELAAAEHANNYLTLYNNSYDGYMICTEDYVITRVNLALINLTGYSNSDLIGVSVFDFIGEAYKEVFKLRKQSRQMGEELSDFVVEIKSKAGRRHVLQVQVVMLNQDFQHTYLLVLKDVTRQTIASEQLHKSEELYRNLFEQTTDSILIMQDDKLVDYNLKAQEIYPKINTKQNCIPYTNACNKSEDLNRMVDLPTRIALALQGKSQTFEWVHTNQHLDAPIYTLVNIKALNKLGGKYYMVVEKDITERKKSQNLVLNSIIQTEENERKRISSDLHDGIGPILTTIKLYAQALIDETIPNKQDIIKVRLLDLVEEAVNSTSEIAFNISPHILVNYGIVAAVESFIKKFNLTGKLTVYFSYDDISRIKENKEITIYRLFTELFNNTLKHGHANHVIFKITETQNNINLYYKDDGVGFNPEEVTFSRSGMGLWNLESRIHSFNGHFVINTAPKKGVEVKIRIPKDEGV